MKEHLRAISLNLVSHKEAKKFSGALPVKINLSSTVRQRGALVASRLAFERQQ